MAAKENMETIVILSDDEDDDADCVVTGYQSGNSKPKICNEKIREWHEKVVNNFVQKPWPDNNIEGFATFMKNYATAYNEIALVKHNQVFEKIANHLQFFHFTFASLRRRNSDWTRSYLRIMETILTTWCKKMLIFVSGFTKNTKNVASKTKGVAQQFCLYLHQYLLGKRKYIFHVLLRLDDFNYAACKDVLDYVFWHFLITTKETDFSKEHYARSYLLSLQWRKMVPKRKCLTLINFKFHLKFNEEEALQHIMNFLLKDSSVTDVVGNIIGTRSPLESYFEYIKRHDNNLDCLANYTFDVDSNRNILTKKPDADLLTRIIERDTGTLINDEVIVIDDSDDEPQPCTSTKFRTKRSLRPKQSFLDSIILPSERNKLPVAAGSSDNGSSVASTSSTVSIESSAETSKDTSKSELTQSNKSTDQSLVNNTEQQKHKSQEIGDCSPKQLLDGVCDVQSECSILNQTKDVEMLDADTINKDKEKSSENSTVSNFGCANFNDNIHTTADPLTDAAQIESESQNSLNSIIAVEHSKNIDGDSVQSTGVVQDNINECENAITPSDSEPNMERIMSDERILIDQSQVDANVIEPNKETSEEVSSSGDHDSTSDVNLDVQLGNIPDPCINDNLSTSKPPLILTTAITVSQDGTLNEIECNGQLLDNEMLLLSAEAEETDMDAEHFAGESTIEDNFEYDNDNTVGSDELSNTETSLQADSALKFTFANQHLCDGEMCNNQDCVPLPEQKISTLNHLPEVGAAVNSELSLEEPPTTDEERRVNNEKAKVGQDATNFEKSNQIINVSGLHVPSPAFEDCQEDLKRYMQHQNLSKSANCSNLVDKSTNTVIADLDNRKLNSEKLPVKSSLKRSNGSNNNSEAPNLTKKKKIVFGSNTIHFISPIDPKLHFYLPKVVLTAYGDEKSLMEEYCNQLRIQNEYKKQKEHQDRMNQLKHPNTNNKRHLTEESKILVRMDFAKNEKNDLTEEVYDHTTVRNNFDVVNDAGTIPIPNDNNNNNVSTKVKQSNVVTASKVAYRKKLNIPSKKPSANCQNFQISQLLPSPREEKESIYEFEFSNSPKLLQNADHIVEQCLIARNDDVNYSVKSNPADSLLLSNNSNFYDMPQYAANCRTEAQTNSYAAKSPIQNQQPQQRSYPNQPIQHLPVENITVNYNPNYVLPVQNENSNYYKDSIPAQQMKTNNDNDNNCLKYHSKTMPSVPASNLVQTDSYPYQLFSNVNFNNISDLEVMMKLQEQMRLSSELTTRNVKEVKQNNNQSIPSTSYYNHIPRLDTMRLPDEPPTTIEMSSRNIKGSKSHAKLPSNHYHNRLAQPSSKPYENCNVVSQQTNYIKENQLHTANVKTKSRRRSRVSEDAATLMKHQDLHTQSAPEEPPTYIQQRSDKFCKGRTAMPTIPPQLEIFPIHNTERSMLQSVHHALNTIANSKPDVVPSQFFNYPNYLTPNNGSFMSHFPMQQQQQEVHQSQMPENRSHCNNISNETQYCYNYPQQMIHDLQTENLLITNNDCNIVQDLSCRETPDICNQVLDLSSMKPHDNSYNLPLKKRIVSEPTIKKKFAYDEGISYPATPMISIAEVDLQKLEKTQAKTIKTAAERKEMPQAVAQPQQQPPPPPLQPPQSSAHPTTTTTLPSPTTTIAQPKLCTDHFNINSHTYNNPTINYHLGNLPIIPYFPIQPILVRCGNLQSCDQNGLQSNTIGFTQQLPAAAGVNATNGAVAATAAATTTSSSCSAVPAATTFPTAAAITTTSTTTSSASATASTSSIANALASQANFKAEQFTDPRYRYVNNSALCSRY